MILHRWKRILLLGSLVFLALALLPLQAEASDYGDQTLALGSRGSIVETLQKDLTNLGFNTYGVDGVFGQNTLKAVVNFQKAQGLTADGLVGHRTKSALNTVLAAQNSGQTLKIGSRGTAVTQLQRNLTNLGYSTYGIDGIFGTNTFNAVVRFQKAKGLAADGIVGARTNAAINAALSGGTPSRGSTGTNTRIYTKLSKVQGSFGQFYYRELSGGRIEIDPNWVAKNIVTITLPGLNRQVQVHKDAADNFIHAFNLIKNGTATINGKQVPLLSLVKTMDGTWVSRHVNWNASRGLSNHSWGIAIDINAANHFRYVNPSKEPNDPNVILWEKAFKPAGFSWGNSYSDAMHYELLK